MAEEKAKESSGKRYWDRMTDRKKSVVSWATVGIIGTIIVVLVNGMWGLLRHLVDWEHRVTVVEEVTDDNEDEIKLLHKKVNVLEERD